MIVSVPRSGEILRRVSPATLVSPTKRVETFCELLVAAFLHGNSLLFAVQWHMMAPSSGSSAFVLIDFNLLEWRLRFFIDVLTLLNLLSKCLRNLRGRCQKWLFFGLHDGILTSASQRSHQGVSPSPKLACP